MAKAGYNPGAAEDPATNPDLIEAAKSLEPEHETLAGTKPEPWATHPTKGEHTTTAHVG